jgi:hypothetical protein
MSPLNIQFECAYSLRACLASIPDCSEEAASCNEIGEGRAGAIAAEMQVRLHTACIAFYSE